MTNTMTYKGYAARIEYDDEDGIFTGRIAGIRLSRPPGRVPPNERSRDDS